MSTGILAFIIHFPELLYHMCVDINAVDKCKEIAEKPFVCPNCGGEFHVKWKRLWFKKGYRRVQKKYPELARIVRENMQAQEKLEQAQVDSVDRAADATATMLAQFSDYALGEKKTPQSYNLCYAIGKWIYLIDALDDYDKDKQKGAYNPFLLAYGADSRTALLQGENGDEVRYIFNAVFFDIRENLSQLTFHFNRDLSDNILLRGLPMMTKRIMDGCGVTGKCKTKDKTAKTTETKEEK